MVPPTCPSQVRCPLFAQQTSVQQGCSSLLCLCPSSWYLHILVSFLLCVHSSSWVHWGCSKEGKKDLADALSSGWCVCSAWLATLLDRSFFSCCLSSLLLLRVLVSTRFPEKLIHEDLASNVAPSVPPFFHNEEGIKSCQTQC